MRIGIDCRMYSSRFTGIGRYVYELTHNLFKLDQKNEYVLFFNEPEYSQFKETNSRIKKVLVNASHYSIAEQVKFLYILNSAKLDLMHFTHFNRPILYNKPSVVTIHDLTLSFYPGKKMTHPLYRNAYHITFNAAVTKARKIIAVSENTKKDLQNLFRTPSNKIEVVYEGVNENFHQIEDQSVIENVVQKYKVEKPYILYTGVWRTHKNLPNLIKAFAILKNDYAFDSNLVITGRKDPLYAEEVEKETYSLKLENDVFFTGLVDDEDLVPLYNGASLYVFPSLYEGFGLPPLEAMQCGIPVVASNTSSIPEICGEDNALFFDPKDPEDIAQKMFEVLSQKTLQQKLIQRGLQRVKDFSWKKMAAATLKIYENAGKPRTVKS